MILAGRAARLALRPTLCHRGVSPAATRAYVDVKGASKASQPAKPGEVQSNTTLLMTGLAGVGLAACYFIFLSRPDVVASEATGDPDKAKNPKMKGER
ncbi:hypothetical protein ED733_000579 [Metarhizium rileyi]|uniref:Uncharacterized protein n=1 Tax=Metarhizium rileyi (strain RCEF 4871) TaxID=1649241 RepID=A0A5C6G1E1_METRR|nr:hypothetical protein ED733_000579 [Metarhizium rileyi]